jgi:thiol-disulfide isomerase/thioredoxin
MRKSLFLALIALVVFAAPALAERVQVYSIQGVDCGRAEPEVADQLKKVKGVKKWTFDDRKFEFSVTMGDKVKDEAVLSAIQRTGCFRGLVGSGLGAKTDGHVWEPFPAGSDFLLVTDKGSFVGPLEKLRVPGKYTVLDFYADWCGPCRDVDKQLRSIAVARKDVAVRKLNIVHYETPLAKQLGRKLRGLPYLIVFSPDGKKTEILGGDSKRLAAVLGARG